MLRPSKSVLAISGTILAAGLLTLAAPRAVHAVAAALVQVTNTASNPVVTQGIGQQATQMAWVECDPGSQCSYIYGGFVHPSLQNDQYLVVTSIDIDHGGCTQASYAGFFYYLYSSQYNQDVIDLYRPSWDLPANSRTSHFAYPSGIVFGPGGYLSEFSDGVTSGSCGDHIFMTGYITTN